MASNVSATALYPQDWVDEIAVMRFAIRQLIGEMETMVPVQVVAVHPGAGSPPQAGTVDVQLLLTQLDGNGNATQPGVVYGVPYMRVQGGPWCIVVDPAANDFGYIQSAYRDISNVASTPGISNPGSYRRHSFSDGIYVGGAFNKVPAAYAWFKSDGTFNITDQNGVVLSSENTPTPGINITGDLRVSGQVTAFAGSPSTSVTLHNHLHIDSTAHFTTKPIQGT